MSEPKGYLVSADFGKKLRETVARVQGTPNGGQKLKLTLATDEGPPYYAPKAFRVCTATGAWSKGESKECTPYGMYGSSATISVVNLIVSLPEPKDQGSRIYNAGKHGNQWYLISFEMGTATAVFCRETASGVTIGETASMSASTGSTTRVISFASVGTEVSVVTDVQTQQRQVLSGMSVAFNSQNCSVVATPSYTNVTTVSGVSKTKIKTAGDEQTVTITVAGPTQTFVFVRTTATMSFVVGTYTATYITLEM